MLHSDVPFYFFCHTAFTIAFPLPSSPPPASLTAPLAPLCFPEYFERRCGLQEDKFHWQVPPGVLRALPFFWGLAEDMEEYRRVICSLRSVRGLCCHQTQVSQRTLLSPDPGQSEDSAVIAQVSQRALLSLLRSVRGRCCHCSGQTEGSAVICPGQTEGSALTAQVSQRALLSLLRSDRGLCSHCSGQSDGSAVTAQVSQRALLSPDPGQSEGSAVTAQVSQRALLSLLRSVRGLCCHCSGQSEGAAVTAQVSQRALLSLPRSVRGLCCHCSGFSWALCYPLFTYYD